jgi:hypothetical protein
MMILEVTLAALVLGATAVLVNLAPPTDSVCARKRVHHAHPDRSGRPVKLVVDPPPKGSVSERHESPDDRAVRGVGD